MINEQIEKFYKNNTSEIIKIVKQQYAFGSVQIEVNNLFVFSIQQSNGHAKIDYNYEKRLALDDEEKKTYLDNQDALLLYESLSGDIQNSSQTKLNDFNALYSKIEVNRSLIDSPYGQVSKALEFYRRNDLSGDRAFKFL